MTDPRAQDNQLLIAPRTWTKETISCW